MMSNQLFRDDTQHAYLKELYDLEPYDEAVCKSAPTMESELIEHAMNMLKVNESTDDDYKRLLSGLLTVISRVKPIEDQTKNDKFDDGDGDDDDAREEEEKDPHLEAFVKCLMVNGNYCMVKSQKSCSPLFIKYEHDESLVEERDLDYKRKLRSAKKKNNQTPNKRGHDFPKSDSSEEVENSSQSQRQLRSERVENMKKLCKEENVDNEYGAFLQAVDVVDGMGYIFRPHSVVYEDSDDEVEILDGATFNKGNSSVNNSSEFRRQLMDILKKPYDEKEYEKLWFDVELSKPEERHRELRHGRERSSATDKSGKSYLDYHSGLRRQLSQFQDDKPKLLNLLRGFFFWLEKSSQDNAFQPWNDAECLAISPDSG
ncbi:BAH domain [Striga asiatica]|uniref:BAH domain n=1 Tax=Striga asiatica TaxID=4170 RepID=A0A5A7Q510_STRAF|nr:BAH domain [Striga asiatica]